MGALGQVSFFVALIVVILVHEAAHFAVAKGFGIKVTEFFVGFGPRLWSARRGETEYGVKAIPAGGYVKIAGMNPYERVAPEDEGRVFGAKPIWQRALVIFAGPATHFVLALLAFGAWLGFVGHQVAVVGPPTVAYVADRLDGTVSPAATAGLRVGDRIVGVDGIEVRSSDQVVVYTREHVGEPITLRVDRDGRSMTITVTPVLSEVEGQEVGRIGVELATDVRRETLGPVESITEAGQLTWDTAVGTVREFGRVFGPEGIGRLFQLATTDAPREAEDPASVIGVARIVGQTAEDGRFWDNLTYFALVNIFIGLLNLVPLPPFDGGHLGVLAIEKVTRRKVDMRKIVPVSAAVAVFLVFFTLSVIYVDLVKPPNLAP
jgi:membrane-associated protease RseP (regulator of RpoE activity)